MNIVGYSDVWSVRPGERIRFMVSSTHARYSASIVRLFHGDPKPGGPERKDPKPGEPIRKDPPPGEPDRKEPGRNQPAGDPSPPPDGNPPPQASA